MDDVQGKRGWGHERFLVVIDGADLENGILVVYARVEVPEERRPRKIQIGSAGASKKKEFIQE